MHLRVKMLAAILVITGAWMPRSFGQQLPTRSEPTRMVQLDRLDMAAILASIAADYQTTIGLEVDPAKPRSQITLELRDVNFQQILDGIVNAEPKYRWRENDGSIEVFPVSGGSSLLDTPIRSFQVKEVNRALAVNRLLGLPEVQAMFSSMNLKLRPPSPPSDRVKDEKLSLDLSAVTLRQALNRIATDSGAWFWAFRRYADGTFEITMASF